MSNAVDFTHADKYESLLQIDTNIFWWRWSSIPKVCKIASLQCLNNILKEKLEMKLTFWMQMNIKVSYKLISTLWASKYPTRGYYDYWWAWSSILKVLKVTNLQYSYNISKKKLGIEFIFCMQINIKRLQVGLLFLMKVARHVQITQNRKFVKLLQYIKKKYCNCFCVLLWWKRFRYFTGFQPCLLLLVFGWLCTKMSVVSETCCISRVN